MLLVKVATFDGVGYTNNKHCDNISFNYKEEQCSWLKLQLLMELWGIIFPAMELQLREELQLLTLLNPVL